VKARNGSRPKLTKCQLSRTRLMMRQDQQSELQANPGALQAIPDKSRGLLRLY
jgi:hypothetical protein